MVGERWCKDGVRVVVYPVCRHLHVDGVQAVDGQYNATGGRRAHTRCSRVTNVQCRDDYVAEATQQDGAA